MKITKRQLKAALTVAYEAGFDGGRVLQYSPTDAVKRIAKHEAKHAKMRKLKNVRKHWNVNNKAASFMVRGELGAGKSVPVRKQVGQDDSNTLSDLLADYEGMDSAQVYASLDPTSTTSDNNESNASKLNETPTKEDV